MQEAFGVDGTVSDVARRHDVLPQQIYAWRRKFSPPKLNSPEIASFIPVLLVGGSESSSDGSKRRGGRLKSKDVEIVLRNGRLLRIAAEMDLEVLSSLVACVEAA